MNRYRMYIIAVTPPGFLPGNAAAVLLASERRTYYLPVFVNSLAAHFIAERLKGWTPSYPPLAHDLIKNILDSIGVNLTEISINSFKNNRYTSTLTMDGANIYYGARPSDALLLSICYSVPITVYEIVLDTMGMVSRENELRVWTETWEALQPWRPEDAWGGTASPLTVDQLLELIEEAVREEDYEKAARYKNRLNELINGSCDNLN
jgi:bifunctional DNase/RNase